MQHVTPKTHSLLCKALVNAFDNVVWSYVNCRSNKVACELAHKAYLEMNDAIWDVDFPSFVSFGACSDLLK